MQLIAIFNKKSEASVKIEQTTRSENLHNEANCHFCQRSKITASRNHQNKFEDLSNHLQAYLKFLNKHEMCHKLCGIYLLFVIVGKRQKIFAPLASK